MADRCRSIVKKKIEEAVQLQKSMQSDNEIQPLSISYETDSRQIQFLKKKAPSNMSDLHEDEKEEANEV